MDEESAQKESLRVWCHVSQYRRWWKNIRTQFELFSYNWIFGEIGLNADLLHNTSAVIEKNEEKQNWETNKWSYWTQLVFTANAQCLNQFWSIDILSYMKKKNVRQNIWIPNIKPFYMQQLLFTVHLFATLFCPVHFGIFTFFRNSRFIRCFCYQIHPCLWTIFR